MVDRECQWMLIVENFKGEYEDDGVLDRNMYI